MPNDPTLDDLRREIDEIDDQIHDLLMRRTDIVGRVGALKRRDDTQSFALRPGREAEILRRIVGRHKGPFPPEVLVRIWRELLSAQVAVQGKYSIGVFAPDDVGTYRDLGRDQFGGWVPVKKYPAVNQVVQEVWNGKVSIGILPFPVGERSDPWWRALVTFGDDVPRIVARLPFMDAADGQSDRPAALAIAMMQPERTGDDVSLVAIERQSEISRDRIREDLAAAGLETEWIAAWHDPDETTRSLFLVSIDDFLEAQDPRLGAARERLNGTVARIVVLGSYARPIGAGALKAAE